MLFVLQEAVDPHFTAIFTSNMRTYLFLRFGEQMLLDLIAAVGYV